MVEYTVGPEIVGAPIALVIEDDVDWRRCYVGRLKQEGWTVVEAELPRQAREFIDKGPKRPDIIFVDWEYEIGDEPYASTFLDWVATRDDCKGLYIVIVSGHVNFDSMTSALRRGASDWIDKKIGVRESAEQMAARLPVALKRVAGQQLELALLELLENVPQRTAHDMNYPIGEGEMQTREILDLIDGLNGVATDRLENLKTRVESLQGGWERLRALQRGLVDLSKSGKHRTPIEFDLSAALSRAWMDVKDEFRSRQDIQIETAFQENLPHLLGHEDLIENTFHQLIENAVKAMPKGGKPIYRLHLGTERRDNYVIGFVGDEGVGIAEDNLKNIFRVNYTSWHHAGLNTRGTGFGLYLAKKYIVDWHGGEIRVSSVLNKGTRFEVYLPLGSYRGISRGTLRP